MKLLLDTNRFSDLTEPVAEVEAMVADADEVLLPFVVLAEIHFGFRLGTRRTENERRLARFLNQPGISILYPTAITVSVFADLKLQLRRQGTPIPDHDIWIAALALQHGLTLYARDRHFDNLPQLARA